MMRPGDARKSIREERKPGRLPDGLYLDSGDREIRS